MDEKGWKHWIDLGSDVCWEDHDGMWARKDHKTQQWFIVRFMNLWGHVGEREAKRDGVPMYEASVKTFSFEMCLREELESAARSCDEELQPLKPGEKPHYNEPALLYACISYGLGCPVAEFTANKGPIALRNKARREAERLRKDAVAFNSAHQRVVNAIGSTAAEYGYGDLSGSRIRQNGGMLMMKQSDLRKCPFSILMPDHYNEDGSCRCRDEKHRVKMKLEWGYTDEDFKEAGVL